MDVIGAEDKGLVKQDGYVFVIVDCAKNGIIYNVLGRVSCVINNLPTVSVCFLAKSVST